MNGRMWVAASLFLAAASTPAQAVCSGDYGYFYEGDESLLTYQVGLYAVAGPPDSLVYYSVDGGPETVRWISDLGVDEVGYEKQFTASGVYQVQARVPGYGCEMVTVTVSPGSMLGFAVYAISKGENIGSPQITFYVWRMGDATTGASVDYATSNGTATLADYYQTSGTLSWGEEDFDTKSFTVTIVNDSTPEPDEYFNVTLSNPIGSGTWIFAPTATVTIRCNDGYNCQ